MIVFNPQRLSDCSQRSVGSIKELLIEVTCQYKNVRKYSVAPDRL
jgi:hypothetical protein